MIVTLNPFHKNESKNLMQLFKRSFATKEHPREKCSLQHLCSNLLQCFPRTATGKKMKTAKSRVLHSMRLDDVFLLLNLFLFLKRGQQRETEKVNLRPIHFHRSSYKWVGVAGPLALVLSFLSLFTKTCTTSAKFRSQNLVE